MPSIIWLGHASFCIEGKKLVVYIDPWKLSNTKKKADLILVTHEHYDHCSADDIEKIKKGNTLIIAPNECEAKLGKIKAVKPGDSLTVNDIKIEAVPAYNTNKKFHPKENGKVGYILTIDGQRIYHAGDTDFIPEMSRLGNIDIALLPVGGIYTMAAEEAVKIIKPKLAIPMHYGDIVGEDEDAKRFKELAEKAGFKTEILKKG